MKKHPELPNCLPVPLKFKPTPYQNASGEDLTICKKCGGSGTFCTAEKEVPVKGAAGLVHNAIEILKASFPGSQAVKYQRQGWTVETVKCESCNGAGIRLYGEGE